MTEHDKKALLKSINMAGKILNGARDAINEIAENILLFDSAEKRLNAVETQIKLHDLIKNLHRLIHCYIEEADQKGYEVVWKEYTAIDLVKNKNLCDTNPFEKSKLED